ncbi:WD40 repeat domain-containing protein, partial [Singulisphaera rosea]
MAEALQFSPDGSRLATAVFRQDAAYVFDLKQGRQIARLKQNEVRGLSFTPDGKTLITGGWDSKLLFWETDTGNARGEFKLADHTKGNDLRIEHVVHSREGGWIATAHLDGSVLIWQADEMRLKSRFNDGRFNSGDLTFSPDGLWLATGADSNRVTILDPSTGKSVWDLGRHQNQLISIGFSRDARTLVSGSGDGICYVWDLRSPSPSLRPEDTPTRLVDLLFGDDTPAAFQAMAALADLPDPAVALLSERLRPLTSVVDLDRVDEGISSDEAQRRRRLRVQHINKDPKRASVIAVRRALSLLTQIGTPEALAPIKS